MTATCDFNVKKFNRSARYRNKWESAHDISTVKANEILMILINYLAHLSRCFLVPRQCKLVLLLFFFRLQHFFLRRIRSINSGVCACFLFAARCCRAALLRFSVLIYLCFTLGWLYYRLRSRSNVPIYCETDSPKRKSKRNEQRFDLAWLKQTRIRAVQSITTDNTKKGIVDADKNPSTSSMAIDFVP